MSGSNDSQWLLALVATRPFDFNSSHSSYCTVPLGDYPKSIPTSPKPRGYPIFGEHRLHVPGRCLEGECWEGILPFEVPLMLRVPIKSWLLVFPSHVYAVPRWGRACTSHRDFAHLLLGSDFWSVEIGGLHQEPSKVGNLKDLSFFSKNLTAGVFFLPPAPFQLYHSRQGPDCWGWCLWLLSPAAHPHQFRFGCSARSEEYQPLQTNRANQRKGRADPLAAPLSSTVHCHWVKPVEQLRKAQACFRTHRRSLSWRRRLTDSGFGESILGQWDKNFGWPQK